MSRCDRLQEDPFTSLSNALLHIDCTSERYVAHSFDLIFGQNGSFGEALSIMIGIYIAIYAVNLVLGRGNLSLATLTPKMLKIGVLITFTTSWLAYQEVFWNLLVRGPDAIAGIILGASGSATYSFAVKLDYVLAITAQSAQATQASNSVIPVPGSLTPQLAGVPARSADILWLSNMMFSLGTVGVLIVARICSVILISIGPVFISFGIFKGTHGFLEGWLKAVFAFSVVPLFAVLLGTACLNMLEPAVAKISAAGGTVPLGLADAFFLSAFVYLSLMFLSFRAAMIVAAGFHINSDGGRGWPKIDFRPSEPPNFAPPNRDGGLPGPALDSRLRHLAFVESGSSDSDRAQAGDVAVGVQHAQSHLVLSDQGIIPMLDGDKRRDPRIRPLSRSARS
ncbi:type IV secretion system protein [Novosphingobium sp. ERN07]|uniref:type IV secretion system protein n=1 Tax=Novosphingobium sp. ERN07 TaxID=2726187 RepID=UPI00145738BE|nr:type IV secretion system protein [Novosphingobium sp. ERN07]